MRRSGQIVRQVLNHVKSVVAPGVTTMDLEKAAEKLIAELGATPAFKGYYGYPCVLCTSINEEIVHGIPSEKRVLKAGDIVSIDCGVVLRWLLRRRGHHRAGGRIADAGVEEAARSDGSFAVQGHRAGEDWQYGRAMLVRRSRSTWKQRASASCAILSDMALGRSCTKRRRFRTSARRAREPSCREGMVLAIEPMVNSGGPGTRVLSDKWTAVTRGRQLQRAF